MVDVEQQVEALERDVDAERAVLEPAPARRDRKVSRQRFEVRVEEGRRVAHRVPQFHGTISPLVVLVMSTTGFRMPGTAALAMMADQMTQLGAVRYCRAARDMWSASRWAKQGGQGGDAR